VDQNEGRPLSADSSDDLGAVGRNGNLNPSNHHHSSSRAPVFGASTEKLSSAAAIGHRLD
jgi:hypothetical protein